MSILRGALLWWMIECKCQAGQALSSCMPENGVSSHQRLYFLGLACSPPEKQGNHSSCYYTTDNTTCRTMIARSKGVKLCICKWTSGANRSQMQSWAHTKGSIWPPMMSARSVLRPLHRAIALLCNILCTEPLRRMVGASHKVVDRLLQSSCHSAAQVKRLISQALCILQASQHVQNACLPATAPVLVELCVPPPAGPG